MRRVLAMLLGALMLGYGCAGMAEFRVPREFKGKKQKEDPPLTQSPAAPAGRRA